MKKVFFIATIFAFVLSSCVSNQKYADLETRQKETQDLLNSATVKLNTCLEEKVNATAQVKTLQEQVQFL
ncbi:MAG: hypothetical protein U1C58_11510, partial [Flavobacteriaceae bacterium]|nr:hypothetical protein [Flavobacteriaceae bacterium]